MMRKEIVVGLALAGMGAAALAQSGAALPPGCRQDIVRLCGRDREAIRPCLRSRAAELRAPCREALIERARRRDGEAQSAAQAVGRSEIAFGDHALQRLDYWPAPAGSVDAPIVLFIHGGGWSIGDKRSGAGSKPAFYTGLGMAFASLNYRLVPEVTPADQAADIAAAIARLRRDAARLGHDPDRIILMGHSAGAHLAALVATDSGYLERVGVPVAAITGVVLLDGAGYDVPRQLGAARGLTARLYRAAFGDDPARQRLLSPITHVGGTDAANWLILHVAARAQSRDQSQALGQALSAAGATATVVAVPDSSHGSVNRDAGVANSVTGSAIARFIAALPS